MKSSHARYLNITVVLLLMLTAFLVGYQTHRGFAAGMTPVWASVLPATSGNGFDDTVSLKPVQLFQEALMNVQSHYVDPITDPDQLTYAAIRGMLAEIKDPYTRFMDPKEFKEFNEDNEGHFAGIGATLKVTEIPVVKNDHGDAPKESITCPVCQTKITDIKAFRVTIVEPLPGTPAKKAGLQPGDFIQKINDQSTEGMTVSDAAGKIRGPEGTQVTLTIVREGVEKPFDVTIVRDNIEVPAVESKVLDGKIGYLRLMSFNEKTVVETRAALMDFNKAGVHGMILDLRSNPGGLLTECVKVASMVLPQEDKVIVYMKGRNRQRQDEIRIGKQIFDRPIVVLVNKGSASASEILTGALKDYKRATVVGETTFGKAMVQTVLRLGDFRAPCAMPVTTARYYTPSGFDLNKKGIVPDVEVALDKETKELNEKDNQALAALKILREEIARAK